jgi:anti-anti-sigma factor
VDFESTEASLRPTGGLVLATVGEFEAALLDLAERKQRVVAIDLSNLSVIDASGLEAIVAFERQLRDEERVLVLRHPSPMIKRVLDVTGLTWLLEVQSWALEMVTSGRFRTWSTPRHLSKC